MARIPVEPAKVRRRRILQIRILAMREHVLSVSVPETPDKCTSLLGQGIGISVLVCVSRSNGEDTATDTASGAHLHILGSGTRGRIGVSVNP